MGTTSVRVAIADDHELVRTALCGLIGSFGGFDVVVQAANGAELIKALEQPPPVQVAIVDLHMPVMDGYATIGWLREHRPATRVLALTFEKTEEAEERALRSGACGFLLKDMPPQLFRQALLQACTLGRFHSDELHRSLVSTRGTADRAERRRARFLECLTERELLFMRLVCHEDEYTYEQIADRMQVHRRTVDGYREALFNKLAVKSKAGLVLMALKWRLLEQ